VPEEVKQERLARFMQLQAEISEARLRARIGQTLTVLVDQVERGRVLARSRADAPEIDGTVFVSGARNPSTGDFISVKVTRASEHDLWARRRRLEEIDAKCAA